MTRIFDVRMTHYRHQAINFSPSNQFLNVSEMLQFTTPTAPFNASDITAVCFNVGRVTPAMIDVHAQAFQQMAYQWSLNTNTIPAVQDYQGAAAYMMGMDYYSHVSPFLPVCEQLHKVQVVSWYAGGIVPPDACAVGFAKLHAAKHGYVLQRNGSCGQRHQPSRFRQRPAGRAPMTSAAIMDGEIAAQEHGIINGYYQSQNCRFLRGVAAVGATALHQWRVRHHRAEPEQLSGRGRHQCRGLWPDQFERL